MKADEGQTRSRQLAVIMVIFVVAALQHLYSVVIPVLMAAFIIALAWPVYDRVERISSRWLAFVATMLTVLAVFAVFVGVLYLCGRQVAERAPEISQRMQGIWQQAQAWAQQHNLPISFGGGGSGGSDPRIMGLVSRMLGGLQMFLGLFLLVLAFMLLGLLEVRDFQRKLIKRFGEERGANLIETTSQIAGRVRRYLVALSASSAVSGVLTGVFALIMGLDLALLWGLLAFLLNYIPTIGPLVATFPPTLFALLQGGGTGNALIVFFGIGAIQFLIGNFVDPKIEGHALSISPVVVLFAVVFWGWLWGVLGALLAVPLTVTIVIICRQFEATRWIAALILQKNAEV